MLLAGVVLGVMGWSVLRATNGLGGVPLDDAWIHFQFARNLARGQGLSFNPGQPTAGTTAPFWTFALAIVYWLGGPFPISGQALSAVCFLSVPALTYCLGKQLFGNRFLAWIAGAVVAVNGRLGWAGLSALETSLFAALSLLAMSMYLHDRDARRFRLQTGGVFGLAALCRPEGYLLFALAVTDFGFTLVAQTAVPWSARWRRVPLLPAAVFAVSVAPYLVFSWITNGHLLPNTYHAKAVASVRPDTDFLSGAAQYLIFDTTIMLPFCVLGALVLLRRARLIVLWGVGLPLIYAFMHVPLYQHGRYLMPLIPANGLCIAAGLSALPALLHRWSPRVRLTRAAGAAIVSALVLAGTGWRLPTMARLTASNVDNINQMHVALGHWAKEHTPPGALLAVNDIGAIAYISERPVLDLAGLVTPEVVPILYERDRDRRLADLIVARGVQYVIIFPTWFPNLAARTDILEPVFRVTLEHNTIAGSDTMVVYRTRWAR